MDVLLVLAGVFLFFASWSDLKSREVPDWLSFSLIILGLGGSLSYALLLGEWSRFLYSVLGFLAGVVFGLVMFYTGQWGGGDAKLVMGLGAVFGLSWHHFPLLVVFLMLTMVVGAVYGVLFGFFLAIRNWVVFKKSLKEFVALPKVMAVRKLVVMASLFLVVFGLWLPFPFRFLVWTLVILGLIGYYLVLMMKVLEKTCMVKQYPVFKLTEGDWIFKEVIIRGKRVWGPKDLGITLEQIATLKKLKAKQVWVKEGVPFVPSFFIAYILTLWKSEWFLSWFF